MPPDVVSMPPKPTPILEPGLVPLSRPLHDESQWLARSTSDQLLISPIFATPGKGDPWGWERCRTFLDGLPEAGPKLLALGGIDPINAPRLRHPQPGRDRRHPPFWAG